MAGRPVRRGQHRARCCGSPRILKTEPSSPHLVNEKNLKSIDECAINCAANLWPRIKKKLEFKGAGQPHPRTCKTRLAYACAVLNGIARQPTPAGAELAARILPTLNIYMQNEDRLQLDRLIIKICYACYAPDLLEMVGSLEHPEIRVGRALVLYKHTGVREDGLKETLSCVSPALQAKAHKILGATRIPTSHAALDNAVSPAEEPEDTHILPVSGHWNSRSSYKTPSQSLRHAWNAIEDHHLREAKSILFTTLKQVEQELSGCNTQQARAKGVHARDKDMLFASTLSLLALVHLFSLEYQECMYYIRRGLSETIEHGHFVQCMLLVDRMASISGPSSRLHIEQPCYAPIPENIKLIFENKLFLTRILEPSLYKLFLLQKTYKTEQEFHDGLQEIQTTLPGLVVIVPYVLQDTLWVARLDGTHTALPLDWPALHAELTAIMEENKKTLELSAVQTSEATGREPGASQADAPKIADAHATSELKKPKDSRSSTAFRQEWWAARYALDNRLGNAIATLKDAFRSHLRLPAQGIATIVTDGILHSVPFEAALGRAVCRVPSLNVLFGAARAAAQGQQRACFPFLGRPVQHTSGHRQNTVKVQAQVCTDSPVRRALAMPIEATRREERAQNEPVCSTQPTILLPDKAVPESRMCGLWYLLDAANNLPRTKARIAACLTALEQRGWPLEGVAGREMTGVEAARAAAAEAFLYFGHGTGRRFFKFDGQRPLALLLFGCSSARLLCTAGFRANGELLRHLRAQRSVFGMLWDVTDGDLDRLTLELFASLDSGRGLFEAIGRARGACRLLNLNGAAAVLHIADSKVIAWLGHSQL